MRREWPGAMELDVSVDGAGALVRALAYPALTGCPKPGDRVLINTTALDLGLGTGGYALVIAVPERLPPDPVLAGHLVKARYSPLQATVLGADEQGSPHHEVLREAGDLGGMPVVVADLHSALPAVLAGLRAGREVPPVAAYVMLDGGALPAWFSRTTAGLRESGWLAGTVSTGQAFGGDLDTVTVSRSPPNDCPVVTVAASHPASLSVAQVRENQAGRAPPSCMTYTARGRPPESGRSGPDRSAVEKTPASTAGSAECRSATTTGIPPMSSASRSTSWCGDPCSSAPSTVACSGE